jgi:uncharacterized membrane protein YsdA (DUF1294 family)/cold shock CspA family protein
MRFEGTVKSWNDERGFGFIAPSQGGQEIFFHIKAFPPNGGRPKVGEVVTFELELNAQGKKRASLIRLAAAEHAHLRKPRRSASEWGTASYFAIPAFCVAYFVVALLWRVPSWVAPAYLAASLVCFASYAIDKSAATAGRWRVAENTLLALGLAGGWPGAIVAQQLLRHKSSKASFRSAFWATVAVNVAAFVLVCSPLLRSAQ